MSLMALLGGDVIDQRGRRRADVLVDSTAGVVLAVGAGLDPPPGARRLDAGGCVVCPGFVDLHVHLRQPGGEDAETVETGARAAALGGCTAVVAMPNTEPALDSVEAVRQVQAWAKGAACAVHPSAAATLGRRGEALSDLAALHEAGVRLFTDDGAAVEDAGLMRRALEATTSLPGAVIAQHAECAALVAGGCLHEGAVSARLGLGGRPAEAEEVIVQRDLALARLTGGRLHVQHASAARTAAAVAAAKAEGVRVTMEVTPHHLCLTDEACAGLDTVFKVNPPLRTAADVEAMRRALAAGVVDALATDHAPHTAAAKALPFEQAPPGMLGLETALGVVLTELVAPGVVSLDSALAALSWRPAAVAGLALEQGRPVAAGEPANLCVFDPAAEWTVDPGALASKSANTPFAGWALRGRVRHTLLRGEAVVVDQAAQR